MDGTSPGNMPVSLDEVWVGTTACAPNPQWMAGPIGPGPGIMEVFQVTVGAGAQPQNYVAPQPHTHYRFAAPQRLSDEDVERIAKRVAELLREPR
jgi:hypothetical protein